MWDNITVITYLHLLRKGSYPQGHSHDIFKTSKTRVSVFASTDHITKTCLYDIDPLKPQFLYSKTGVYGGIRYFFLFLLKNINCGYSLEPPRRGGSNEYLQPMFWAEIWKMSEIFIWKFSVFGSEIYVLNRNMKNVRDFYLKIFSFWKWNFSLYLNRHVFVMRRCSIEFSFVSVLRKHLKLWPDWDKPDRCWNKRLF